MNRETRIGLLVGLLFIIMFGLVLSEFTGRTSPQMATAQQPVDGGGDLNTYLWAPPPVSPARGSGDISPAAIRSDGDGPAAVGRGTVESSVMRPAGSDAIALPPPVELARLDELPPPLPPVTEPQRTYEVQPGDSLVKIARKVYGPQHEREYKRIVEANKNVIKDERSLAVGTKLVIPPLPQAAPVPAPSAPSRAPDVRLAGTVSGSSIAAMALEASGLPVRVDASLTGAAASASVAAPPPAQRKYIVKKGDSLAKIARQTLNDDSKAALDKLMAANRGKLRDRDALAIGMELQIPG
jgi:nucleoid-associated protein YgaU